MPAGKVLRLEGDWSPEDLASFRRFWRDQAGGRVGSLSLDRIQVVPPPAERKPGDGVAACRMTTAPIVDVRSLGWTIEGDGEALVEVTARFTMTKPEACFPVPIQTFADRILAAMLDLQTEGGSLMADDDGRRPDDSLAQYRGRALLARYGYPNVAPRAGQVTVPAELRPPATVRLQGEPVVDFAPGLADPALDGSGASFRVLASFDLLVPRGTLPPSREEIARLLRAAFDAG